MVNCSFRTMPDKTTAETGNTDVKIPEMPAETFATPLYHK